jgi:hypothetical protein
MLVHNMHFSLNLLPVRAQKKKPEKYPLLFVYIAEVPGH